MTENFRDRFRVNAALDRKRRKRVSAVVKPDGPGSVVKLPLSNVRRPPAHLFLLSKAAPLRRTSIWRVVICVHDAAALRPEQAGSYELCLLFVFIGIS